MAFSPIGLVVGAALARGVEDRGRASQIEILGGVLGASPMGLVLLSTLAKEATVSGLTEPTEPNSPSAASVPDISTAKNLAEAGGMLKARGLTEGRPEYVLSSSSPDAILGSSPNAGALVPLGTKVSILVNAGLIVPPVTGMTCADAQSELEAAGFQWQVKPMEVPGKPGEVTKQDPGAGDLAFHDAWVTLYVVEKPHKASVKASSSAEKAVPQSSPGKAAPRTSQPS
jgi:beta-lactam-binding protein with PASTA domain